MAYNGHPSRQIPNNAIANAQFMYPFLSQLTPLPQSAVINNIKSSQVPSQITTGNNSIQNVNKPYQISKNIHPKQQIQTPLVQEVGQKTQCPICHGHFSRKTVWGLLRVSKKNLEN